jgi:hypothetical protein
MPNGFERQKLVYVNIKALGIDGEKKPCLLAKINENKTQPGYQPYGYSSAAYSQQPDYSPAGQKNAYEKMKDLQRRLKL